jgi:HlyD family secretion protein
MMKFVYTLVIVVVGGFMAQLVLAQNPPATPPSERVSVALSPLMDGNYLVAAPGRVEPVSEEIAVGAPLTGLIKQILVKEGDLVHRDQVIATLDTAPFQATLAKAEAQLHLRETELLRLTNGARQQDRDVAQAALQEAEAAVKYATIDRQRRHALVANGFAPRADVDRADRDYNVAVQQRDAAAQRFSLVNDPARDEDLTVAQAQVDVARADRDKAKADLSQAVIRSPIDGTVLRVHRREGEVVSLFIDPRIVTVGDLSRLQVRADIDESDIGKLQLGMPAYVTADAFGDERFSGHVVKIGRMLGKKNIQTDEPKEHMDTKILEVVIALDDGGRLPPGLRVNAFLTGSQASEPKISMASRLPSGK